MDNRNFIDENNEKNNELYIIKRTEIPIVSKITTDSFLLDPYFCYMFYELNDGEKKKFIHDMEIAFLDQVVDFDQCYSLDDSFKSCALLLPPLIGWPEDKWDLFTDIQRDLLLEKGYNKTYERLLKLEEFISIRFEEYDAINSYYLITLSTNTLYRKQGLASKLLNKLFEKFDIEETKCYIECTNDINLQFYLKHGFTILGQEKLPNVGDNIPESDIPQITFMHRIPKKLNTINKNA